MSAHMRAIALTILLFTGCVVAPAHGWYVSHAAAPSGGQEWHTCRNGGACPEGYACVKDGCEWCGGDDGVLTRCTNGND